MSIRPRTPLTRTRILEAAIELVDREGPEGLSMRRLGKELGVEAMSLYNHVDNKQDVLDGMAGLLVSRMTDFADESSDWKNVVRRVSRAYRDVIIAHPNVFLLSKARPLVSGEDQDQFHATMHALIQAGFSQELALDLFNCCAGLVRGFAMGEEAYGGTPTAVGARWNEDRSFERGLDALIEGFGQILEREQHA